MLIQRPQLRKDTDANALVFAIYQKVCFCETVRGRKPHLARSVVPAVTSRGQREQLHRFPRPQTTCGVRLPSPLCPPYRRTV